MARERFDRDINERQLVSDLMLTASKHLSFFNAKRFREKIDTIYLQEGFLSPRVYVGLNTHLLNLNIEELPAREFAKRLQAILKHYSAQKRVSLLRQVMIFPPFVYGEQPAERRVPDKSTPQTFKGKSLGKD